MNKNILLIVLLVSLGTNAQNTFVPDDIFEQALIDMGYDNPPLDNYVPTANIDNITVLTLSSLGIFDLTGIEDFSALQILYATSNNLATIDISQNLNLWKVVVSNNQLSAIDVSQNALLEILNCGNNFINSLNLSQNPELKELYCEGNNLSQLSISNNPIIEKIFCSNNMLSSLNTSANPNLKQLYCYGNNISSLNVTQNTELEMLYCYGNNLSTLDVSQNTYLRFLLAPFNQISNINLSNNINLTHLDLSENNLNSIDITNNLSLENLYLSSNNLLELDVTLNNQLKEVVVFNNQIDSLDFYDASHLIYLMCDTNHLESLNVRNGNNTNISGFYAQNNPDLECIEVDDPQYSEANWPEVDPQVVFSEDCNPLGIIDNEIYNLSIYPNPVNDKIFIKSSENIKVIQLYDLLGKMELETTQEIIELNHIVQGVYILKVILENGTVQNFKVIK